MLNASDLAYITSTVQAALDVSLPLYRKTISQDGYGHSIETYPNTPTSTIAVNLKQPSATQLVAYAGKIGSQRALIMRAMQTTDIREGDRVVYDSLNWIVSNIQNAESYTVTKEYLLTVVA